MHDEEKGHSAPGQDVSTHGLILLPFLFTLGVTLLRLAGELQRWSPRFFTPGPGGVGAIVGISWLPVIFGPYFALKLAKAGERPASLRAALKRAGLGVLVVLIAMFPGFALRTRFSEDLVVGIVFGFLFPSAAISAATVIQYFAWPSLFKALLAYAFAARIPVTVIMFFAFRGNWGTHYDALPPMLAALGFWTKFLLIGVFVQLVVWVGITILVGALLGTIATAFLLRPGRPSAAR